jgi:transcriptional regulator with XRE-family HTH domain
MLDIDITLRGAVARALGEQLRALRLAAGMTQADLAERSGGALGQSMVSAIERGEKPISGAVLLSLSEALGCGLEPLMLAPAVASALAAAVARPPEPAPPPGDAAAEG